MPATAVPPPTGGGLDTGSQCGQVYYSYAREKREPAPSLVFRVGDGARFADYAGTWREGRGMVRKEVGAYVGDRRGRGDEGRGMARPGRQGLLATPGYGV